MPSSRSQPTKSDSPPAEVSEDAIEAGPSTSRPKSKTPKSSSKRKGPRSPGIVYISRLPPGMTPHKVKHLMARWGEVGRVYAQARDGKSPPTGYNPNADKKKQKHQQANYSEAWVEFMDKSVAKTVATMLNAEVIGGKKGDRWRDDIWTMRYLSGFKWEMLGEQVAYERQAHQSRLRNEITWSKTEQSEYLRNVELARVLDKRRAKKAATDSAARLIGEGQGKSGESGAGGKAGDKRKAEGGLDGEKAKRNYRQRQSVDKDGMREKGMEGVLGSVFG